jgi:nicotinate phosphoribosyltransferase
VLELGSRRIHPEAAVDAAYAAWVAGCAGTSNVEAHHRYGIPCLGTMDHFAIQAWERPGVARHETERAFFAAFHAIWPDRSILLVDTYDPFGAQTGIRNAVAATGGKLAGIRLDSVVNPETVRRARALLDGLGARKARIVVSGGLDEPELILLRDAPVDSYGIGERLVTSADAPVGVGAVAKLAAVAGRPTMKLAVGSERATLPGPIQVWRRPEGDLVGCADESQAGDPLLRVVWKGGRLLGLPTAAEVRAHALASLAALPPERLAPRVEPVRVSRALEARVRALVAAGV